MVKNNNIEIDKIRELASDMGHSPKILIRDYWKSDPKAKKKVKDMFEEDDDESS